MSSNPYAWLETSLDTIRKANWYRSVNPIEGKAGAIVETKGDRLVNFASNNYLGLAGDNRLIQAAQTATEAYGTGSTGSRLLTGHLPLHRELEQMIAALKSTEDALVFSSGYLANLGAITALVGQRDLILGDEYNHSSLKQGAKLSQAQTIEYTHNCVEELEDHLRGERHKYRRCLISTDAIFSMDGDICQLPQLIALAEAYDAMLLLDEAHATGVMGKNGAGCVEYFNCTKKPLIQVGTLSKALGSLGGYVAGSRMLIDFLRNRASTWIYTTGLSPADTGAALAGVKISQSEPERRTALWQNVAYLRSKLQEYPLKLLPSQSPIICLSCSKPQQALDLAAKLRQGGILAPAIRPPTVPSSRVRLSVMATHTREHLERLLKYLYH
ncbi:8-amino-7-oxononanoate synthase [Gloeocapsa sp. PCC 73106]|uniref:8-amino-7-oxononanoate synthase n=1 Tax=Gloeocapsa sp. PCC 73106 TaxID=102232 RepID=UPI0002ABC0A3|nr:8-amino-7-oxononanoate synthase [Gloeocapsa sp. PCC 73106]ELR97741.1 8-amino-7-oxononanoate synthase [Gloeocapsa sp. PCC 73106]